MAVLEFKSVSKGFGTGTTRTEVLKGIDLSVAEGEFLVILGFSGTGKTTLINLMAGLPDNIGALLDIDGLTEFHSAARMEVQSQMSYTGEVNMGDEAVQDEFRWQEVDEGLVRGMRHVLNTHYMWKASHVYVPGHKYGNTWKCVEIQKKCLLCLA